MDFDYQAYLIEVFLFTDVMKRGRDWFQQSISETIFKKSIALERYFLGMGVGNPSKKDRDIWERGTLMVSIIVKEKLVKDFEMFLFI